MKKSTKSLLITEVIICFAFPVMNLSAGLLVIPFSAYAVFKSGLSDISGEALLGFGILVGPVIAGFLGSMH